MQRMAKVLRQMKTPCLFMTMGTSLKIWNPDTVVSVPATIECEDKYKGVWLVLNTQKLIDLFDMSYLDRRWVLSGASPFGGGVVIQSFGHFKAFRVSVGLEAMPDLVVGDDGEFPLSELLPLVPMASLDDSRSKLCGVHIDAKRENIVATDGHRLVLKGVSGLKNRSVTVPTKLLKIAKALGAENIGWSGDTAYARHDGFSVVSRCPDSDFPQYNRLIPSTHNYLKPTVVDVGTGFGTRVAEQFKSAADVVFADGVKTKAPTLFYTEEGKWSATKGAHPVVEVNARYYRDMLKALYAMGDKKRLTVEVVDEHGAVIFKSGEATGIVMPTRL